MDNNIKDTLNALEYQLHQTMAFLLASKLAKHQIFVNYTDISHFSSTDEVVTITLNDQRVFKLCRKTETLLSDNLEEGH